MNKRFPISSVMQTLTALFVLAVVPQCGATVINFDNLVGPVALAGQYASQGVLFSEIEATSQFATSVVPVSPPNYATPFYFNADTGSLFFVDPANSGIEAYASSVSITLDGYNNVGGWFDGATIEALNLSGNVIAGQTQVVPPTTGTNTSPVVLTFTGQVHELEFINIQNVNGLGILPFDNLTFGPLSDSPEPSTWLLSGSFLLAFAVRRFTHKSSQVRKQ